MPAVSIIIRSFNEAEYIGDTLEAVTEQSFQDFEIILVDSGSTDGTLEIAERYVDDVVFVDPRNFTFGYSLNVGCRAANGDYLVFLSAHAIPTDEGWLETLIGNLYDEDVAMAYSNQTGKGPTKFSEDRLFDELFPPAENPDITPPYFANNASSAIKRELWEQHKFDEYLTGHEDIAWAKHFFEKGYEIVYEPEACIYHIHDESWEQVYRRFEREAIADREIGVREASERWREYAVIPKDIITDIVAAIRKKQFNRDTMANIFRFRYYQHTGTANGLQKERDMETNRYDYYYPEANQQVQIQRPAELTVTKSSLPDVRPNDVLIKVEYAGVMAEDKDLIKGGADSYPLVPGRAYVGSVADVGANVDSVVVGQRVTGGSVFHCGVCRACDEERYAACENRVELGTADHDGTFSQFITVPSTHVYSVPPGLKSEYVPLAEPLSVILDGIDRVESLLGGDSYSGCVTGDGLLAKLADRYLDASGVCSTENQIGDTEVSFEDCDVIVVTAQSQDHVNSVIGRAPPGSIIFIPEPKNIDIDAGNITEKVLVTAERRGERQIKRALEQLDSRDYTSLVDRPHSIGDFVSNPDVCCLDAMGLISFSATTDSNTKELPVKNH